MKALTIILLFSTGACASLSGVRADNRENLLRISVGMTKVEILEVMGTETIQTYDRLTRDEIITNPYRTEMYRADGSTFEILFYYTDRKAADGAITDDELTPLVVRDGTLDGWGWLYWDDIVTTYEIRAR